MKFKTNKLVAIFFTILMLLSSLIVTSCSGNNNEKNLPYKTYDVFARQEYNHLIKSNTYWACIEIQNVSDYAIEVYMVYDLAGNEIKSDTKTLSAGDNKIYTLKVEIPGFEYTQVYAKKITIMCTKA